MADKTEREDIDDIQRGLRLIKAATRRRIKASMAEKNARHINAWSHVKGDVIKMHANWTDLGFDLFPSFFDEVVTSEDDFVVFGGGNR